MIAWEPCRLGYDTWCDTCRGAIKRGDKGYLVGAALSCPKCFDKTKEGKRRAAVAKRKSPRTNA